MKRLARVTLVTFTILLALIASIAFYARVRTDHNPATDYGLEVCEGKPCFMGVWSGMDWDKALDTLTKRGVQWQKTNGGATVLVNRNQLTLSRWSNIVLSVELWIKPEDFPTSFPELGDIVLLYGPPCQVTNMKVSFAVFYRSLRIDYLPMQNQLDARSIAAANDTGTMTSIPTVDFNDVYGCSVKKHPDSWHGFSSLSELTVR